MNLFDVTDTLSINLDRVVAMESLSKNSTRIFLSMELGRDSVDVNKPLSVLRRILRSRSVLEKQPDVTQPALRQLATSMEQLAKFQTIPVP